MSEADIVTIKFVQGSNFNYFRSTVCGNAPGSILDLHSNPESSFNVGKDKFPTDYTLDRSDNLFRKYVDPILRGYKDIKVKKEDTKMLETDLS